MQIKAYWWNSIYESVFLKRIYPLVILRYVVHVHLTHSMCWMAYVPFFDLCKLFNASDDPVGLFTFLSALG